MKSVGGIAATKPGPTPLVFARPPGEPLVFLVQPVWSWDEFDQLCPEPDAKPFTALVRGEGWVTDYDHPQYRDLLAQHRVRRWEYTLLKSLEPSNIEWDKVRLDDPKTWRHFEEEIAEALTCSEIGRVVAAVQEANNLDRVKIAQATERFFQQRAAAAKNAKSIPNSEPLNSQSGALANASESSRPAASTDGTIADLTSAAP